MKTFFQINKTIIRRKDLNIPKMLSRFMNNKIYYRRYKIYAKNYITQKTKDSTAY